MADLKVRELTADAAPSTDDIVYVVGDPTGTPVDRKVELGVLLGSLLKESHIDGFITANNGTDGDHDIDFGAGTATVSDGTNYTIATTSSTITKQLDASWAVGTAAGGLDAGSIAADTWYHLWVIMRSDTYVVDFLFSTSATSPTMPTNYDFKRRIGAVLTDGSSNILAYTQSGHEFFWGETDTDVALTSSTSTTWASLTGFVTPDDVSTRGILQCSCRDTSSAKPWVSFWPADFDTPTVHAYICQSQLNNSLTLQVNVFYLQTTAASPPAIQYMVNTATVDVYIRTLGWEDPRGRTW